MKTVFWDTSFIIALEDTTDQYHLRATDYWKEHFLKTFSRVVVTSFIFDEVVTHFNNMNLHSKAVSIGNDLLNSRSVEFVFVDELLFSDGWHYFQKYKDKSYSFTDCISFLVMKKKNIESALSFDKHFQQAGFELLPNL